MYNSAEGCCIFDISDDYHESKLSVQCCISGGITLNICYILYFTGTVLEHKAAEHLAHFPLENLASARDKPWSKRGFNDGGVGRGGEVLGCVAECELADDEECRWECQTRVERTRALAGLLGLTKPLHVAAR